MAKVGRNNVDEIAKLLPGKTFDEVTKYHRTFWARGKQEIRDFNRLIEQLLKQEAVEKKQATISDAFLWKMRSQKSLELGPLDISYSSLNRTLFTKEQDKFLLVSLFKHGLDKPNIYSCIRQDIL